MSYYNNIIDNDNDINPSYTVEKLVSDTPSEPPYLTVFDLYNDKLTIDGFAEKAKSAFKFNDDYLLTLKIGSIFYNCLYDGHSIRVSSHANEFFLVTSVSDPTTGNIQTETGGIPLDIACLPGRNKLETIIHILVYFCKMVGIKEIEFTDLASKQTKNCKYYTLLSYRIFATNKDISELSIYSKFFRKSYMLDPSLKHTCVKYTEFLNTIRMTTLSIPLTPLSEILISFKDKIGTRSLLDYFKNFDKEDEEKIEDLNNIVSLLLSKSNIFKNLMKCVNFLKVSVDDYMYPVLVLPRFKSKKSNQKLKSKTNSKSKKSKTNSKSKKSKTNSKSKKSKTNSKSKPKK